MLPGSTPWLSLGSPGFELRQFEFQQWVDTVEKLDFLPRSQFLRQQAGFKKKALRVRQKG